MYTSEQSTQNIAYTFEWSTRLGLVYILEQNTHDFMCNFEQTAKSLLCTFQRSVHNSVYEFEQNTHNLV